LPADISGRPETI